MKIFNQVQFQSLNVEMDFSFVFTTDKDLDSVILSLRGSKVFKLMKWKTKIGCKLSGKDNKLTQLSLKKVNLFILATSLKKAHVTTVLKNFFSWILTSLTHVWINNIESDSIFLRQEYSSPRKLTIQSTPLFSREISS